MQKVNTRLDRPLKPGIRHKTLRIVLRLQIEISRLMYTCWHKFFYRYIYFCVFYIIIIIDRIVYIPFNKKF